MTGTRERANSSLDGNVGQERYELYKSAFTWIKEAIDNGYYLEAISIVESLICDRLESHVSVLLNKDFGFKTLGTLINAIKQHETDPSLRSLILDELDEWRKARNRAAHEMVKIEAGKQISWSERVKINELTAKEGLALLRKIDRQVRVLRTK
ncbi:hypothetical protein H6F51_18145 [Cyanobacteria bacterium FACHB-DQ100]|nr:hypothetical protein [Cyanobacteria bacterium FACHB-DQ100]